MTSQTTSFLKTIHSRAQWEWDASGWSYWLSDGGRYMLATNGRAYICRDRLVGTDNHHWRRATACGQLREWAGVA